MSFRDSLGSERWGEAESRTPQSGSQPDRLPEEPQRCQRRIRTFNHRLNRTLHCRCATWQRWERIDGLLSLISRARAADTYQYRSIPRDRGLLPSSGRGIRTPTTRTKTLCAAVTPIPKEEGAMEGQCSSRNTSLPLSSSTGTRTQFHGLKVRDPIPGTMEPCGRLLGFFVRLPGTLHRAKLPV